MKLIGYHGTDPNNEEKIINKFSIEKINLPTEAMRRNNKKVPGSLGYGFYVFENDKDLAGMFARKFCDVPTVLEVELELDKDKILDLNDINDRTAYHKFRNEYIRTAKNLYDRLDTNRYNIKQHVFDGIIVEGLVKRFKENGHEVQAVSLSTYTSTDVSESISEFSFIPNGTEYCVKAVGAVKEIKVL